jgi:hypothetical protein
VAFLCAQYFLFIVFTNRILFNLACANWPICFLLWYYLGGVHLLAIGHGNRLSVASFLPCKGHGKKALRYNPAQGQQLYNKWAVLYLYVFVYNFGFCNTVDSY